MSGNGHKRPAIDSHEEAAAYAVFAHRILASDHSSIGKAIRLIELSLLTSYAQSPTEAAQAIGNSIRTWAKHLREEAV